MREYIVDQIAQAQKIMEQMVSNDDLLGAIEQVANIKSLDLESNNETGD